MANQKIFTRNYWNLFSAVYGTHNTSQQETETPTHDNVFIRCWNGKYLKPLTGNYPQYLAACAMSLALFPFGTSYLNAPQTNDWTSFEGLVPRILLGTGTGELSTDEYHLFAPVYTNFTNGVIRYSNEYNADTNTYTKQVKIPIAYSGTSPIVITEFGIYGGIPRGVYSSDRPYYFHALLYHELLENPITLEPNDTIEITFSQSIVQPHFSPYPESPGDV